MTSYLNLTILLIILTIIVFLFIISGHNFIIYWHERKFKKKQGEWEPLLYKYLGGKLSIKEGAQLIEGDFYLLWRFLKPYFINLKGDDLELLRNLVAENKMVDFFIEELKSGKRRGQVKAALALGKLGNQSAVPYLEKLIYSDHPSIVMASVKAIIEIGDSSLLIPILRVMFDQTYITFEGMMDLLSSFDNDISQPLMDILEEWLEGERELEETFKISESESLSLIIDLLGYNRHMEALEAFKRILQRVRDVEVLIHIFKSLARLEAPIDFELTSFLNHENWVIRSQVAKYISTTKEQKYSDQLKGLLEDDNWWVRYYAADALFNTGEVELLKRLVSIGDYGSDISRYVLKSKGN